MSEPVEIVTATRFRVGAYELLARAEAGETFLITRYGRPVAVLSPPPAAMGPVEEADGSPVGSGEPV